MLRYVVILIITSVTLSRYTLHRTTAAHAELFRLVDWTDETAPSDPPASWAELFHLLDSGASVRPSVWLEVLKVLDAFSKRTTTEYKYGFQIRLGGSWRKGTALAGADVDLLISITSDQPPVRRPDGLFRFSSQANPPTS
jgi:hypothetical protein